MLETIELNLSILHHPEQRTAKFLMQGQRVNIFSSVGPMVSVPSTHLYTSHRWRADTWHGCVPIQLIYKSRQWARWGWQAALLIPYLEFQLSCQRSVARQWHNQGQNLGFLLTTDFFLGFIFAGFHICCMVSFKYYSRAERKAREVRFYKQNRV